MHRYNLPPPYEEFVQPSSYSAHLPPPPPAMSDEDPLARFRSIDCSPNYFGSVNFGANLYDMAKPYMKKFWFEDREFVPDDKFYSSSSNEPRKPNTHQLVKRFLKQVRDSRGYDVDCKPPRCMGSPFDPVNLKQAVFFDSGHYYRYNLHGSATFAVGKINELTGRNYEFVEIVKAVDTSTTLMYLTFTARDCVAHGDNAPVETFQALVQVPYGRYSTITDLVEWRRKPDDHANAN